MSDTFCNFALYWYDYDAMMSGIMRLGNTEGCVWYGGGGQMTL